MKLKYKFESVNLGNEIIEVPVGDNAKQLHGVLKLNKEGELIFQQILAGCDQDQIIAMLSEQYNNDQSTVIKYVNDFFNKMKKLNLIEE